MRWKRFPSLFLALFVVSGCSSSSGPESAGTITVDSSGGGDHTTIQAAVNAAAPGATIRIASGDYTERVDLAKSVTLRGAGSTTRLAAPGPSGLPADDSAILVIRDTAGLTVEGLSFDGGPDNGVQIRNSSDIGLVDVTASGNASHGIDIRASNRVTVSGSTCNGNGNAGIRVREQASNVALTGNTTDGNTDEGVRIRDASNVMLADGRMDGNQDGVRVRDSDAVTITGNAIRDNTEYGIRLESSVVENRATLTTDNVLSGNGSGAVSEE